MVGLNNIDVKKLFHFCVFILFVMSINASENFVDTKIKMMTVQNHENKTENLRDYFQTLSNKYHGDFANEIKLTRKKESMINLFLSKLYKSLQKPNMGRKQQWDTQYGK